MSGGVSILDMPQPLQMFYGNLSEYGKKSKLVIGPFLQTSMNKKSLRELVYKRSKELPHVNRTSTFN